MKLRELARLTGANVDEKSGDIEIEGAAGLDDALEGQVTFLSNPRYTTRVQTTRASAIYVGEEMEVEHEIAVLRARDPYLSYTRALRLFHPEPEIAPSVHETAVIDASAKVADDAFIGAHVVVGRDVVIESGVRIHPNVTVYDGVRIGAGSTIHAGASVREGTEIGERVIIYNNAVIGSDGFGYAKDEEGRWLKIPQTGRVVIEDDVEIGACSTIDKASVGETRIGRGAKIDNLVQVGHSCKVGDDALLCAQVGLAGSSHIGQRVVLTGQVGVGGHLTIGDDAMLYPQSGVHNDIPAGKLACGSPAIDNREFARAAAVFRKLGDVPRAIRALEKRIAELETKLKG
ncbi:MAG TPA: UDP-3-O-(3-hydroxymyristoyl)glucosamine N-acyltransferase [Pyrinomonadaceae bacterium]|nr:UDP-3-O-(3-hydroxymyristoyl)glucosamine N-acyltransferase [Pyrinomonadaceae bacterium]